MMKKMDKKAFTLIELIVVIAVVGILVLLGVPRFTGHKERAQLARIQYDIKVMEQEIGTEFINNDDDFDNWENNNKDFNQLIQEGKLFEKEGIAKEVESTDEIYKVIPEKYKDKINTKLKGTFYTNSGGKVYYEHTKPLVGIPTEPSEPGETPESSNEKIQDLINDGYIPVATAEELNSIRNNEKRIYGEGTKWEGEYEGGLYQQYIQVLNIDLSVYSEEGWNPIGDESANFTGTYDGGNYVITNLEVKGDGKNYQGLFGYTYQATISNVGLIDNKVTGEEYVGGLLGYDEYYTNISNSYSTGSVTGTGNYVGGLAGWTYYNTISNSYSTGPVTGKEYVGGLVGQVKSAEIENSYATGSVTGTGPTEGSGWYVGGLVGRSDNYNDIINSYATGEVTGSVEVGGLVGWARNTDIENSYATGSVTGSSNVGGLVGWAYDSTEISKSHATGSVTGTGMQVGGLVGFARNYSTISNSYATGSVTSSSWDLGGLVGRANNYSNISNSYAKGSVTGGKGNSGGLVGYAISITIDNSYATGKNSRFLGGLVGKADTSTISNSYWDKVTTNLTSSAGQDESFGKTTEEMKEKDTYSGWNFDTVWKIDEGNDYPELR